MPKDDLVCHCSECQGDVVTRRKWRNHQERDLRLRSSRAAASIRHASRSQQDTSPSVSAADGLSQSSANILSNEAPFIGLAEIDMIGHGTMSWSDVYLETPGSGPPYPDVSIAQPDIQTPDLHDPALLHAFAEQYSVFNAEVAQNSQPLMAEAAHTTPWAPDTSTLVEELSRLMEGVLQDPDTYEEPDEQLGPVPEVPNPSALDDAAFDDEDDTEPDVFPTPLADLTHSIRAEVPALVSTLPNISALPNNEDVQDPFWDRNLQSTGTTIVNITLVPPHLLCIYVLVSWLHTHFHVARVACHALLWGFVIVLSLVAPTALIPHVTLKSAYRALSIDPAYQVLPVCQNCREVYPDSANTPDTCTICNTPLFNGPLTARGYRRKKRAPVIKYPYIPLSEQLTYILQTPGLEDVLDDWRNKTRTSGVYQDIFDGQVASELQAPDGTPFFVNDGPYHANGPGGELRLGLTWAIDWFSYLTSQIAPSHSSCPTSFSICNLPPHFRYRTSNLLLTSILPGPREQSPDEIQRFIRPIVSDLLRLWKDGILICTPKYPNGRLVRVILVAVVCDKPAAHKLGGFASHSHNFPCTVCWVHKQQLATPESFQRGAFRARTDAEHRRLGEEYRTKLTPYARDKFVQEHATRYTQLSRLPYFDLVRQIVIDPMHNLFLGLVKTHFYSIWVKLGILREKHELRVLHEMLADFILPSSMGKLPKDIGQPSGGSLTADQWKLLAVIQGPIIIPQLWRHCLPSDADRLLNDRVARIAQIEKQKADEKAKKKVAEAAKKQAQADKKAAEAAKKAQAKSKGKARQDTAMLIVPEGPIQLSCGVGQPVIPISMATLAAQPQAVAAPVSKGKEVPKDLPFSLHPDDPPHFLKLSQALRLLCQQQLRESDIMQADDLLRDYCTEIIRLYGSAAIKPNHHYASHAMNYARDFGPLHCFWSLLFERLNKLLKSYNSNNHGNGELETTFFVEFHRMSRCARIIYRMANDMSHLGPVQQLAEIMLKSSHDARGTVAGLADWLDSVDQANDEVNPDQMYELSVRSTKSALSRSTYSAVLQHLRLHHPVLRVHARSAHAREPNSVPLDTIALFYEYVTILGRRYYSSGVSRDAAFIEVGGASETTQCGELMEIFELPELANMPNGDRMLLGRVRWFKSWLGERETIWETFRQVEVRLWALEEYEEVDDSANIIDLRHIVGGLGRKVVTVGQGNQKVWATVALDNSGRRAC